MSASTDMRAVLPEADVVVYAAPSAHLRQVAKVGASCVKGGAILAVATKGIEEGTLALMTDVISSEHPNHSVVAISGPSFASEVVANQPTAIVAAS